MKRTLYDIEAQSPDDFLLNLHDMKPDSLEKIVRQQAARIKRLPSPETSPIQFVLASLFKVVPSFATTMKGQMLTTPVHVGAKPQKVVTR